MRISDWSSDVCSSDLIEYVVREDQAADYEDDPGVPLNTYPVAWADRYARTHWRHTRAVCEPGGFHGAFTGREWAMRTAQERGAAAGRQLDENAKQFGPQDAPGKLGRATRWERVGNNG